MKKCCVGHKRGRRRRHDARDKKRPSHAVAFEDHSDRQRHDCKPTIDAANSRDSARRCSPTRDADGERRIYERDFARCIIDVVRLLAASVVDLKNGALGGRLERSPLA